jgi:CheY-like chemotaxis protein
VHQSRQRGVLIADNEQSVCTVLNLWLSQEGFAVYQASDGKQAIEIYRQQADKIDVVLLDVNMPGLDGPHALAAIRALNPSIPCCFMSGDLGRYGIDELRALGASELLEKPLHLPKVSQALQMLSALLEAGH